MVYVLDSVSFIDGELDCIESYLWYYLSIAVVIMVIVDNFVTIVNLVMIQLEVVIVFIEVVNEVCGHLLQVDECYEMLFIQLVLYVVYLWTFQS